MSEDKQVLRVVESDGYQGLEDLRCEIRPLLEKGYGDMILNIMEQLRVEKEEKLNQYLVKAVKRRVIALVGGNLLYIQGKDYLCTIREEKIPLGQISAQQQFASWLATCILYLCAKSIPYRLEVSYSEVMLSKQQQQLINELFALYESMGGEIVLLEQ